MQKKRVLLVDDSDVALDVAGAALERAGFEVVTAQTAIGLSTLLREAQPDCIVLDVAMPALSGNKSVEIIRRYGSRELPILLHSDRALVELKALAQECGANGAVTKSADCVALIAAVVAATRAQP